MTKKDRFPQHMLTVIAFIITVTVIIACYFDSPKYNDNVNCDVTNVIKEIHTPEITFIPESCKIDINNATLEELMTLEQIGEVRAQAIIEYRNDNIGFYSVEDIMRIDKIPRSVYEKIKDKLTVGTYTEVTSDVI